MRRAAKIAHDGDYGINLIAVIKRHIIKTAFCSELYLHRCISGKGFFFSLSASRLRRSNRSSCARILKRGVILTPRASWRQIPRGVRTAPSQGFRRLATGTDPRFFPVRSCSFFYWDTSCAKNRGSSKIPESAPWHPRCCFGQRTKLKRCCKIGGLKHRTCHFGVHDSSQRKAGV